MFASAAKGTFAEIYFHFVAEDGILRTKLGTLSYYNGIALAVYFRQAPITLVQCNGLPWVLTGLTALFITIFNDFQHGYHLCLHTVAPRPYLTGQGSKTCREFLL
jgi:hypothetical protein